MARRSTKAANGDDHQAVLPIDGLPARVEPSYGDLADEVRRAARGLASYHALVRRAILAGRKKGLSNKRIARELDCAASHVGRVIDAQLFRQKVAQARPEFPLERVSDSNWESLARMPEPHAYELLDAAVDETVEGLKRRQRELGTSSAQDYRRRSRGQWAGGAESHQDLVLRLADWVGLTELMLPGVESRRRARALIRYEHALSAERVAMAPDAA